MTILTNAGSVTSTLKSEAEKAIANWDERKPMPKRIVITIAKKDPTQSPTIGNVTATVKLEY